MTATVSSEHPTTRVDRAMADTGQRLVIATNPEYPAEPSTESRRLPAQRTRSPCMRQTCTLDAGPDALPLAITRPLTTRVTSHSCSVPSALGTGQGHGEAEVPAFPGLTVQRRSGEKNGGGVSDLLEGVRHAVKSSSRGGDGLLVCAWGECGLHLKSWSRSTSL